MFSRILEWWKDRFERWKLRFFVSLVSVASLVASFYILHFLPQNSLTVLREVRLRMGLDPSFFAVLILLVFWALFMCLAFLLKGLVLKIWNRSPSDEVEEIDEIHDIAETMSEKWLLAISAVYVELNCEALVAGDDENFYRLDEGFVDEDDEETVNETLEDGWNITDEESLRECLDWLLKEGHRKEFDQWREKIEKLSPQEFESFLKTHPEGHENHEKLKIVRECGERGIFGWDIVRYVYVARLGYAVGYLYDWECWELLRRAEVPMRRNLSSWKELLSQWQLGYRFWGGEEIEERKETCQNLLSNPVSPYLQIPFRF